jgi:hypothetical protein
MQLMACLPSSMNDNFENDRRFRCVSCCDEVIYLGVLVTHRYVLMEPGLTSLLSSK